MKEHYAVHMPFFSAIGRYVSATYSACFLMLPEILKYLNLDGAQDDAGDVFLAKSAWEGEVAWYISIRGMQQNLFWCVCLPTSNEPVIFICVAMYFRGYFADLRFFEGCWPFDQPCLL
ncbi:MAG: hypothetical protein LBU24_01030 [Methanocalculaceae archaeon]|jgi:hypothetical protein|nr:hypothetical protein [Methanocalculaceae archaeon]